MNYVKINGIHNNHNHDDNKNKKSNHPNGNNNQDNKAEADAVKIPAADGGYLLLGFRDGGYRPAVFEEIDWSTERVAEQTRARLRVEGLQLIEMPVGRDVDVSADLDWLASELAVDPELAPATARFLREAGLLPEVGA